MKFILVCIIITFSTITFAQSKSIKVEPFLEAIVKKFPNVRDIAIAPNKTEAVFSAQSVMGDISALVTVENINGSWGNPKVISFSGKFFDIEPYYSEDGLTLYFASNRPLSDATNEKKDFDIWYVTRSSIQSNWSKPINIGSPINTKMDEFYPVITSSKNIYFTLNNPETKQKDDIYISEYINGNYTEPKALGKAINSTGYEFNAFVSQDESFIIYTCYNRKNGLGSGDLYISFKSKIDEWSASKNMGSIVNSNKMDYCPFVDTITNTLYFTSKRIGEYSEPNTKKSLEELQNAFQKYDNGLSRLYKISLEEFIKK
jgi:hypothetical protein